MTADELSHELDECKRLACKCRGECKEQPEVHYWVGCTILYCECVTLAVGDWNPRTAVRIWNQAWLTRREFNQKLMDDVLKVWISEKKC